MENYKSNNNDFKNVNNPNNPYSNANSANNPYSSANIKSIKFDYQAIIEEIILTYTYYGVSVIRIDLPNQDKNNGDSDSQYLIRFSVPEYSETYHADGKTLAENFKSKITRMLYGHMDNDMFQWAVNTKVINPDIEYNIREDEHWTREQGMFTFINHKMGMDKIRKMDNNTVLRYKEKIDRLNSMAEELNKKKNNGEEDLELEEEVERYKMEIAEQLSEEFMNGNDGTEDNNYEN